MQKLTFTFTNLNRRSLDSLYSLLENLQEKDDPKDHPMIQALNTEIDARHATEDALRVRRSQVEAEQKAKLDATRAQLRELLGVISGKQMVTFVDKLRHEYEGDYEICPNTFTVYSNVARPDQNSMWTCATLADAEFRVVELIYDRIYFKYMYRAAQHELEQFMISMMAA